MLFLSLSSLLCLIHGAVHTWAFIFISSTCWPLWGSSATRGSRWPGTLVSFLTSAAWWGRTLHVFLAETRCQVSRVMECLTGSCVIDRFSEQMCSRAASTWCAAWTWSSTGGPLRRTRTSERCGPLKLEPNTWMRSTSLAPTALPQQNNRTIYFNHLHY